MDSMGRSAVRQVRRHGRWCDCAFTNKRRGLPQTDGPIGQET
jgi:hypothetical protein